MAWVSRSDHGMATTRLPTRASGPGYECALVWAGRRQPGGGIIWAYAGAGAGSADVGETEQDPVSPAHTTLRREPEGPCT